MTTKINDSKTNIDQNYSDEPLKYVHDENRGAWNSKTEFILSCVGYAVGTGNVWRFPYLVYRSGGGAFLVPYFLMLLICIPLFFMEIIIGQFSSTGCIAMFRMAPIFKGAGYAMACINIIVVCYYSVILSYPLLFFAKIFTKNLPWTTCDNPWNTPNCTNVNDMIYKNGSSIYDNKSFTSTPADEYFHYEILQISSGIDELGGIVWPLFCCLVLAWICICSAIIRGVRSVGKVVYFTALFPLIVLIILFFRGITLPGAIKGIMFYIKPEWKKILDLKIWADAAIQIFFSLGPGWGGIVNMASYNKFNNNAMGDSIFVPIVNTCTSFFAGFTVFSVLGFLSEKTGIPVATVATSGPGLAFVTYPQAIAFMPLPQLWAALFFLMLFFLGLDSVIEAVISSVLDEVVYLRKHKTVVTVAVCSILFLMSIIMTTNGGMYILQVLDWYSSSISVIFICFVETIMVSYLYGLDKFKDDIFFMFGKYPNKIWIICLKYLTPGLLLFIFFTSIIFNRSVSYNDYIYPKWAIAIGWLSCAIPIICVPIYAIYILLSKDGSCLHIIKTYSKAYDWTPASVENRLLYENYLKEKENQKLEMENKKVTKTI